MMPRSALALLRFCLAGAGFVLLSGEPSTAQSDGTPRSAIETCGGVQFTLEPAQPQPEADLLTARRILNYRLGEMFGRRFNDSAVQGGQIMVNVPEGAIDSDQLAPLLSRGNLSFHQIYTRIDTGREVTLPAGQHIVVDASAPQYSYILANDPVVDGAAVVTAAPMLDATGRPSVEFAFSPEGTTAFATYTAQHIGEPFAIVLDGVVLSAPTIRDAITGGRGILTGDFTETEAAQIAASLRGGVLPFDLVIAEQRNIDGSDPSAGFCP